MASVQQEPTRNGEPRTDCCSYFVAGEVLVQKPKSEVISPLAIDFQRHSPCVKDSYDHRLLRPHTRKKRRTPELGVRLGSFNPLAQASSRRIDWVADGFAGHEKLDSPVLLPAAGIIVGGNRQSVAETSG